jgi:hypothetical protein
MNCILVETKKRLTNVCAMQLIRKVLEHELGQGIAGKNKLSNCNAPFGCVALQMPVPVRPGVCRVDGREFQGNHLQMTYL